MDERYSSSSSEGQGLFSSVGQDRQWVHRPSPERVLLVKLRTKHLAWRKRLIVSILRRHTKRVPSMKFSSGALLANSDYPAI